MSIMTRIQAQIIELFKTLDQTEQREVAQQLYERAVAGSFYDRMTRNSLRNSTKELRKPNEVRCVPQRKCSMDLRSDSFDVDHSPRHGWRRPSRM
jgi:hypothetical protein